MDIGIKATFTGTEEDRKLFTPKEWPVYLRHAEGWIKKEIADYVCRSPETIKTYESSIMRKTGTHSMTQAVLKGIAKGIVTITSLCFMLAVNMGGYYVKETNTQDTRRAPRTVRTSRVNRSFRDFIV